MKSGRGQVGGSAFLGRCGCVWWVAKMTNGGCYCKSELSDINISFTVFTVWSGYENDLNVISTQQRCLLGTLQIYV